MSITKLSDFPRTGDDSLMRYPGEDAPTPTPELAFKVKLHSGGEMIVHAYSLRELSEYMTLGFLVAHDAIIDQRDIASIVPYVE